MQITRTRHGENSVGDRERQLHLEQRGFDLRESTDARFLSINTYSTVKVSSLPCDFLNTTSFL